MTSSPFGKQVILGGERSDKNIWTSIKIDRYLYNLEHGIEQETAVSPFFDRKLGLRKGNINFQYSKTEEKEIEKCMNDIVYFANNYCFAMTDEGVQKITLRDYQKVILKQFAQNRYIAYLASRQIGKTIMSAIYMMWYLCFNFDRNVMVVANKAVTMMEIMDKMKVVYQNLPYFLKPGLLENNKSNMKFDNGCRIQGQATSDTPALGFAIHLLYADEFAHIPQNIVEPFYRSIYPTLSSSDISQMIITSTPNGINKFYDIYQGAVHRKNDFIPLRTDWWEVPGRDDKWRDKEVGNLGSVELFNQEYGNQFLTSDKLLLDNDTRRKMEIIKKEYQHINLHQLDEVNVKHDKLKWSPKMMFNDFKKNKDKYVLSIDIADGIGKDYSVINIFKIEPFSLAKIRTLKKYKDESSFFRLRQVGLFHSNDISIDAFGDLISALIFDLFGPDSVSVVLEMNFKGDLILDKLEKHRDFYIELLLHTKHSQNNDYLSPGLKLNRKNKPLLCNEFGHILKTGKIILDENLTFIEASSFGLDKNGNYSSQLGNDDIMMTCINLTAYIDSDNYYIAIEDIVDHYSPDIRNGIQKRLSNIKESDKNDDIDYAFLRDMFNN